MSEILFARLDEIPLLDKVLIFNSTGTKQGLQITQNASGTITGGSPFEFNTSNALNFINVTADTINRGDFNGLAAFAIIHKAGGLTVTGQRAGLVVQQWLTDTTAVVSEKDIGGATFEVFGMVGNNGANFIAASSTAYLDSAAIGAGGLTGYEIDIDTRAGATVANKFGLTIVQSSFDAVHGSSVDAGIAFYNNGPAGWNSGILFNAATVSSIGTVFDASALTKALSGGPAMFIKGPGLSFYVDGNGNVGANTYSTLGGSPNVLLVNGTTSGTGQIVAPAVLGTRTWNLPAGSGTFVVSATSPLAIDSAGNITVGSTPSSLITVGTTVVGGGTTNGVLFDDSGAKVNSTIAGTNGQLFLGVTGSPPAWGTMSGDATISNSGVLTLASIITAGGPTGSATVAPIVTYDVKGRLTAVSSTTITPAIGSITGLGTGVGAALAINVGSTGAFVTFNGAMGTPSSGVATNLTTATVAVDTNTTVIASTAFVLAQAASATPLIDATVAVVGTSTRFARGDHVHPTDTTRAALASPTFTGTPAAPTAAVDTNTTQLATTAFMIAQAASATPLIDGTAAAGTSTRFARGDHVHPTDTTRAALASPTFTGTPSTTTAAVDTNSTQIASTAFVIAQAASATPLIDGTATVGTSTRYARGDHIHPTDTTRAPVAGRTSGTAVSAGNIGEVLNTDITLDSVSITSATPANLATQSVPAGDYDVQGVIYYLPGATTITQYVEASIGTTSATRNLAVGAFSAINLGSISGNTGRTSVTTPVQQINVSSTTNIYLVSYDIHTTSTMVAGGRIFVRRRS